MTKTHTMRSRLISLVLVLVMVLGCLPMSALAADPALESTFDANGTRVYGDFHVSANLTEGYQLQTVGSEKTEQDVGITLRLYNAGASAIHDDQSLRIELYDQEGNKFRLIDVENITYWGSSSKFAHTPTVFSYGYSDGSSTPDHDVWQPTVSINPSENGAIVIEGIHVTLTGSGNFPIYARITSETINVGDGEEQHLGSFDIKAYDSSVPTVNLTFNLDATDAYYCYSTVTIPKDQAYKLPTVTPIREHYTFKEWKLDDTTYLPGDTISYIETNKDLMLTAVWERDTVEFSAGHTDLPTGVKFVSYKVMLDGEEITNQIYADPSNTNTLILPYGSEVYFTLGLS